MSNVTRLVVQIGSKGVALAVVGASTAAVSTAAVIAAVGGGVAVAFVGYGVYRYLASSRKAVTALESEGEQLLSPEAATL